MSLNSIIQVSFVKLIVLLEMHLEHLGISKGHAYSYSYQKHRQVLSSSKASCNNFNENLTYNA